jgi:quinol monooxygenase YgiN
MADDKDQGTGAVRVSGRLICSSWQEAEILRSHLLDHIRLTQAEPGCIVFDVSQTDDPLVWRVEESFRDQKAYELHQKRTRSSAWWAATAKIRRDYQVLGLD